MKIRILPILSVVAMTVGMCLTSCSKDEIDTNNAEVQYGPAVQITASAQLSLENADKAYMIGTGENFNKVVWEANDQITVNNSVLAMEEIDPDNLSHARFSGSASPNTYLESNKDVYRSVYPASIISSIPASASPMVVTLPATQAYDYTSPVAKVNNNYMAAYASVNRGGNLIVLKYRNLCSILKIQVTAPSGATGVDAQMSRLRFASASGVSGNFQVTFSNGIPVMTPSDPTADNILEIVYSTPVDITTTKTFFVMLPPMSSQGFVMQVVNGDGSKVIQKEKTSATFQRNKVYTTTINETFGDWGRTYSVSDNQRVYFAHGNLKYKLAGTDAGAWRFFDEQYGMCTSAEVENTLSQNNVSYSSRPSYVAVSQNGTDITPIINRANTIHDMDQWTDHFCFGTSGFQAGSIFYQPWHTFYGLVSNAGANRIYTDNGYGYGPMLNGNAQNLSNTNSDWGVYHRAELNNSLTPSGNDWRTHRGEWRTPTQPEWLYVIQGAKRIDNISIAFKYGLARIEVSNGNYVNGLMMIPDKWHWFLMPGGHTFHPFIANDANNDFSDNTYTLAEWQSLDEFGACFLPAGGTRLDWLMDYGEGGFYQSSTASTTVVNPNPGNGCNHANQRGFSMHFYSKRSNSQTAPGYPHGIAGVWGPINGSYVGAFNKIDGHNVRLVRNTYDE